MNTNSNETFLNLTWIGGEIDTHRRSNLDISISILKDQRISFTFRNQCWKKMANNGACGKIEFAIFNDNIIVFRCSSNGYTLYAPKNGNTRNFKITVKNNTLSSETINQLKSFVGNYTLNYEDKFNLWYISKNA